MIKKVIGLGKAKKLKYSLFSNPILPSFTASWEAVQVCLFDKKRKE